MPNWKKIVTSGSDAALNSLSVTNGITGSLLGTASFAVSSSRAISSSFASTASFVNTLNQDVNISGSLAVSGSQFQLPNISNAAYGNILYWNDVNGNVTYAAAPTATAATVDEINLGTAVSAFVQPDELEQSKHTTINIFNNLNFF